MNILFLAHPASIHDQKWMKFAALSVENHCVCIAREADRNGINQHHLNKLKENNIGFAGVIPDFSIARPWQTIRGYRLLRKIIKNYRIDLLHILYAEPNALWVWGKKYLGVPVMITTRGSDILLTIQNTFLSGSLLNAFVKRIYKSAFLNAEYITGTSQLQLDILTALTGRKEKMELIRTGVNVEEILAADKNKIPETLKGKKYIFFPRNMRPVYNHEFALEAIASLPVSVKKNYVFVFINADSQSREYTKMITKKMEKMRDCNFVFLPTLPQEEVFALYAGATMVVMTPRSDGSPVSAMEAMALKVPVILPDMIYDTEIFNKETVSFFKTWRSESLRGLVVELLNNTEEIDLKTENAFKIIIRKCNSITEMKRFENVLKSIYDQTLIN